ncbi:UNVERIFIED_ORG: hypothetical protein ABIB21_000730 [Arthrobacter sp. UYEF13]
MKVPQLHVGAGSRLGPLSIFPVWTSGSGSLGISTGTHADVSVSELAGGAQVARLTVTNNGPHPALLLEGELLEGGQQHRTCVRDVVLGTGETRDIDTFCVEAGRWEAGKTSHLRQARRAPLNVWSELANVPGRERGSDRQRRIWERVSRFDNARGASATSSLLQHMDRFKEDKEKRNRFDAADAPKPLEGQRGVVVGLGQQPLLLEVFGTSTLFLRHYRQLIEAALLDLELLPPQALASCPMPGQRARDFAAHVQAMDFGTFDNGSDVEVRDHGGLRSRNVSRAAGAVTAAGIAAALPQRRPQLAHLTGWNTKHPLMEMA